MALPIETSTYLATAPNDGLLGLGFEYLDTGFAEDDRAIWISGHDDAPVTESDRRASGPQADVDDDLALERDDR